MAFVLRCCTSSRNFFPLTIDLCGILTSSIGSSLTNPDLCGTVLLHSGLGWLLIDVPKPMEKLLEWEIRVGVDERETEGPSPYSGLYTVRRLDAPHYLTMSMRFKSSEASLDPEIRSKFWQVRFARSLL